LDERYRVGDHARVLVEGRQMTRTSSAITAVVAASGSIVGLAEAQDNVFELGKLNDVITVIGEAPDADTTDNKVTIEDVWTFNRNTLDEAIKLVPGVTSTLDGTGRRNERGIFVRGFGRWQVPLSIDGVRIYLPADNRLDFNRFLTQDLAEIEVQKGYVSVLDGPGGMGGAINLVTRKPTETFETELRAGGGHGFEDAYLRVGSLHESFYVQVSASYLDRDYWDLSDDFVPTTSIEDGGERSSSDNRDTRANFKIGFTPNDGDEYSLSYTSQTGEKGAPLNVFNDPPNPPNSYWRWPSWDIGNLYWLSVTRFGDNDDVTLRTSLFNNTFENSLHAYDDATYTTQSLNGRFQSFYDDEGYGGSVEVELPIGERNTFGAAYHQRRDEHTEYNDNRPTNPAFRNVEPIQKTVEDTWSLAVENTFAATGDLDLVAGLGYEENDLKLAQEFNAVAGLFEYPTGGSDATNVQGAAHWRYAEGRELRGVISSRTRFPTIFERFSTRFGTAIPNPDLEPERAVNYELGWSGQLDDGLDLTAALFYADVEDMIQTIVVSAGPPQVTQTQNVGDGEFYGVELGITSRLTDLWSLSANYTHLEREINDPLQPGIEVTGAPDDAAFVAFIFEPSAKWTITPSLELASDRWSELTGGGFVQTGDYTLLNLQAQYRGGDRWELAVGGTNLSDEDFQLAHGYPEPGASAYLRLRLAF
jgi:iron complex outermembrane receptor protein